jgi:hypothetical protein
MTVMLLSAPIRRKAFGAKGMLPRACAAAARRAESVHSNPMVSATAEAALDLRKSRRVCWFDGFSVMFMT